MNTEVRLPIHLLFLVFTGLVASGCGDEENNGMASAVVRRGALEITYTYEAILDSRRTEAISARYAGGATLIEVAEEGQRVVPGDVLARFDDAQAQREAFRLMRDTELARLELDTLENATIPLELDELEMRLDQARAELAAEEVLLGHFRDMARDSLLSAREVKQQEEKAAHLNRIAAKMQRESELMRQYSHPARLARARATYLAAMQELSLSSQQVAHCVIHASSTGMVMLLPLHVGTEYRTVRIGDMINKNQTFMALPDIGDWIALFHVPEVELGQLQAGAPTRLTPLAYPGIVLTGQVERVSTMAQDIPGAGNWVKQFRVSSSVEVPEEAQALLRPGMSARLFVTTYQTNDTLLVPRAAVRMAGNEPVVQVRRWHGGEETRTVEIGRMSRAECEILSGLAEGDEVLFE